MIDVSPIVDQLKAAGCARVEGALEYAALDAPPPQLPMHFVIPSRETAAENRMAGVIDQKVTVGFEVIVIVAGQARRIGAINQALYDEVERVITALFGWQHPDMTRPCEYVGGQMVTIEKRVAVWSLSWRTSKHLRRTA